MTHLMSSLDVLVFAELCVLYYMEYGRLDPHRSRFEWRLLITFVLEAAPLPASSCAPSYSTCT